MTQIWLWINLVFCVSILVGNFLTLFVSRFELFESMNYVLFFVSQVHDLVLAATFSLFSCLINGRLKKYHANFYNQYKWLLHFVNIGFTFSLTFRSLINILLYF